LRVDNLLNIRAASKYSDSLIFRYANLEAFRFVLATESYGGHYGIKNTLSLELNAEINNQGLHS
jgi:hypothetical protein